jgi:hypothetical protein
MFEDENFENLHGASDAAAASSPRGAPRHSKRSRISPAVRVAARVIPAERIAA